MSVDAVTTFLALLACLAIVVTVLCVAVTVGARREASAFGRFSTARATLADVALPFAFAVALTCTLGSLYLSEVAKFPPCELCWYQRIAMYPLAVVLGIAALRRDTSVRWYVVPIALIGLAISTYHYLLERFPDDLASSCSADVPCTTVWVWKFHFLSIPGMAGIGFATIATLALIAASPSPVRPKETAT